MIALLLAILLANFFGPLISFLTHILNAGVAEGFVFCKRE